MPNAVIQMKRSYTCPPSFKLAPGKIEWAMSEYNISREEAERQTTKMQRHEFQRKYGAWNLVWHRWFEKANEDGLFKRERTYTQIQDMTEQEKSEAQKSFDAQIARFRHV